MSEEDKQPYHALAQKDKERRRQQIEDLMRLGYFMLEDGSKSTDVKNLVHCSICNHSKSQRKAPSTTPSKSLKKNASQSHLQDINMQPDLSNISETSDLQIIEP